MTKKVLFVCIGNSGRSQMAEAFFNVLSKEWKAGSAGINLDSEIHPLTIRVMADVGIDVSERKPKKITPKMMEEAEKIVVMGINPDFVPEEYLFKVEEWI